MTEPFWGQPSHYSNEGFPVRWWVRKARGLTADTVWSVFSPDGVLAEDCGSWREAHRAVTDPWTAMYRFLEGEA